jgi:hypothetical protein
MQTIRRDVQVGYLSTGKIKVLIHCITSYEQPAAGSRGRYRKLKKNRGRWSTPAAYFILIVIYLAEGALREGIVPPEPLTIRRQAIMLFADTSIMKCASLF